MHKYPLVSVLVVTCLTACTVPPAAPPAMGSVHAWTQAPHIEEGQQWTYRRIDLWKNEEVEQFSQTFNRQQGSNWSVAWGVLSSREARRLGTTTEQFDARTHGFADARMKGTYIPLKFPLAAGQTWSFSYQYQSKPDTLIAVDQTAVVTQWETVTVPAGQFKTLRVEHSGRYKATQGSQSWRGRITETYWYSPETGRVVVHEYKDTTGTGKTWDQRRDELVALRK